MLVDADLGRRKHRLCVTRCLLSRFATLCVFLVVAASCSSTAPVPDDLALTDATGSSEPVTLNLWGWDGVVSESIIEQFERDHPGIEVELTLSGFDQNHLALEGVLGTGADVPDVAAIEVAYLPSFMADTTNFIDLRRWGANEMAGDYLDWRWVQAVGPDGEVVGIPTDVGGLAIAYRRDLFGAAGLPTEPADVAKEMETWDQFIRLGVAFRDGNDSPAKFLDSVGSLYYARLGQEPTVFAGENGEPLLAESPGLIAAWNVNAEAIETGIVADLLQFSPEWNDAIANGGFAALAAPSWMRGYLESNAPTTDGMWGLVPLPGGGGGNWGGSQLVIPEGAENPEEAWLLVQYLTNIEGQAAVFEATNNLPSTPALYENDNIAGLSDAFFNDQVVGPIYIESVLALPPQPTVPWVRELDVAFVETLQDLQAGVYPTSEAAWVAAIERAEGIVD